MGRMIIDKIGVGNLITLCVLIMTIGIAWGATQLRVATINTDLIDQVQSNKEEHKDFVTRRELELYIDKLDAQYEAIHETQLRVLDKLETIPKR